MKKLIAAFILLSSFAGISSAAPTSYVQIGPTAQQSGGFNVLTGTITNATITNAHIVNATIDNGGGSGSGLGGATYNSTYGGTNAGQGVTTPDNVALGSGAMGTANGTLSSRDTYVGTNAGAKGGYSFPGADGDNTAVGWYALPLNLNGWQNTAIGSKALYNVTSGFENTGIGMEALANLTSGSHNVAIGAYAGSTIQTGIAGNIFIGHSAGGGGENNPSNNSTGDLLGGILIGVHASAQSADTGHGQGTFNTIGIGREVITHCINCAVIGDYNEAMMVGVGTATPVATLQLNSKSNIGLGNSVFVYPKFSGYSLLISTDSPVNQYDLSVDTDGVVAPRILQLTSQTKAQLAVTTPKKAGQEYYCSDCSTVAVCISTGTTLGGFSLITNKGSACN